MIRINKIFFFFCLSVLLTFGKCCNNVEIVNGETADIADFPHQVYVWYRWPSWWFWSYEYKFGGGTIIGPKHILTAAHVVDDGYEYFIRAGASRCDGGAVLEIEDIILHPEFDADYEDSRSDIAIIVLKDNIKFNDTIQAVEIAYKGIKLPMNHTCNFTGCGSAGYDGPVVNQLMKTKLQLISRDECRESYNYMPQGVTCFKDQRKISTSKLNSVQKFKSFFGSNTQDDSNVHLLRVITVVLKTNEKNFS